MLHQSGIRSTGMLFVVAVLLVIGSGVAITYSYAMPIDAGNLNSGNNPAKMADANRNEADARPEEREREAAEKALLLRQRDEAQRRTTWNQPACVAGHERCVDCHKQEIRAWLHSKHSTRAFDLLRTSENALEYARKLDIRPIDITRSSLCVNCHGTPQVSFNGRLEVFPGVSCESCHGSSLGENGWLNAHAVYGTAHTLREQETPEHYVYRQQRCDEAGHLRSSDLYGMTKRCFECHVVGDEALSKAGHTHGERFEMVAKALGEIRHNFVLNENENARVSTLWTDPLHHGPSRNAEGRLRVMFLLGQMVDLEISFRGLARATAENDFSDSLMDRIEEAYELLAEDVVEEIEAIDMEAAEEADEEGIDPVPRSRPELAEIKSIVEIVAPVWETLDDEGFRVDDVPEYLSVADSIAPIARRFSQRNGNALQVIDQLELLPEDIFEGAYDPTSNQNSGAAGEVK